MSIKTFEEGINSRVEVDEYCFEVLARSMIMKFKLTVAVEFDVKKNKNNKTIVVSYLGCAYNHVLLEKRLHGSIKFVV